MTPEYKALVAERKSIDPKGTPNLARKWMDRAVAAIESLSAQSAQPQAGEAVTYEPCGGCGNTDPTKRCIGCLHPFTPASPQPANPPQVTDAFASMLTALRQVEAEMRAGLGSSYGETREQVRRAIASAERCANE